MILKTTPRGPLKRQTDTLDAKDNVVDGDRSSSHSRKENSMLAHLLKSSEDQQVRLDDVLDIELHLRD
ncbi:hypothetical protein Droror1_Dr00014056 [Drosera rotundifolia]